MTRRERNRLDQARSKLGLAIYTRAVAQASTENEVTMPGDVFRQRCERLMLRAVIATNVFYGNPNNPTDDKIADVAESIGIGARPDTPPPESVPPDSQAE